MIGKLGGSKAPYLSPTHDESARYGLLPWITLREAVEDIEEKPHHYVGFPEKRLKYYRMLKEANIGRICPKKFKKKRWVQR